MWWNHKTEPEPGLDGRSFPLPHGKLVGGIITPGKSGIHVQREIFR
jgi:hypothetical protein